MSLLKKKYGTWIYISVKEITLLKNKFNIFLLLILVFFYFLISNNYFSFYVGRYFDGCDMPWSPSNLYLQNIDVFKIYFSHLKNIKIHCSNYPAYSILNIFFFLPIGYFELTVAKKIWLCINLIFLFHIYIIIYKKKIINKNIYNFLFLFFLFSKPTITTLSIGQMSVMILWAFVIFFYLQNKKILSSAAYLIIGLKYSFFPIVFYYSLFSKLFKRIILITLINILAVIIYTYKFETSVISTLINPLTVGSEGGGGGGDLMSVLGNHPIFPINYIIIIGASFFYFYIFFYKTHRNNENNLICASLITITIFRHHIYDTIFLFPLLIYLIKSKNNWRYLCVIIIFYFWFIYQSNFLEQNGIFPIMYTKGFRIFNYFLLNILLLYFFLDNLKLNQTLCGLKLQKIKKYFDRYEFKIKY